MTDCEPPKLSQRLQSWMQHTLQGSREPTSNNCPALNSAEVWRRLVVPVFSLSTASRMPAAKSLEYAPVPIILWEKDLTPYQAAGGTTSSGEDMR